MNAIKIINNCPRSSRNETNVARCEIGNLLTVQRRKLRCCKNMDLSFRAEGGQKPMHGFAEELIITNSGREDKMKQLLPLIRTEIRIARN